MYVQPGATAVYLVYCINRIEVVRTLLTRTSTRVSSWSYCRRLEECAKKLALHFLRNSFHVPFRTRYVRTAAVLPIRSTTRNGLCHSRGARSFAEACLDSRLIRRGFMAEPMLHQRSSAPSAQFA